MPHLHSIHPHPARALEEEARRSFQIVAPLLLELGVTSLGELSEVLVGVDETEINARMDYRYPPGAVRRLDDALLASYAQAYVDLHGNAHRVDLLRARLAKLTG